VRVVLVPRASACGVLWPQALVDAMEAGDVDAFTTAVADFDSLTRLDAWKTTLLVRPGGGGGGGPPPAK
jgi:hypothetical protein